MKNSLVSIDLAKNVFQVCAMDDEQKIVFNKKVSRKKLLHTLSKLEPTTVIMEACYTAHLWGRAIQALGHSVKLIPHTRSSLLSSEQTVPVPVIL
jgi:transposase